MRDTDPVLRILCADDDRDTADSLVVLLEIAGLEAHSYYDGRSVLAAASIDPDLLRQELQAVVRELAKRFASPETNAIVAGADSGVTVEANS